jgi:hypothetical protein
VLAQLRADAPHGGQRGLLCRGVHAGTPVVRARHAWVARIGLGADGARVVLRERAVVHGGKGRKVKRRRFARAGGIVASDDRGGDLVGHRDVEFGGEPRLQLDRGDLCVAANVERLKRVANRRELLAELLYHELLGRSGVGVRHGHVGRGCGEGVRCLSLRGWAAAGRCTSLYEYPSTQVRYSRLPISAESNTRDDGNIWVDSPSCWPQSTAAACCEGWRSRRRGGTSEKPPCSQA